MTAAEGGVDRSAGCGTAHRADHGLPDGAAEDAAGAAVERTANGAVAEGPADEVGEGAPGIM